MTDKGDKSTNHTLVQGKSSPPNELNSEMNFLDNSHFDRKAKHKPSAFNYIILFKFKMRESLRCDCLKCRKG